MSETIFTIGLLYEPLEVRTVTTRTIPYSPGIHLLRPLKAIWLELWARHAGILCPLLAGFVLDFATLITDLT